MQNERLKQRFPEATSLYAELDQLSKPLSALLTCNDTEVTSEEEYLAKAKELSEELVLLGQRLGNLK